MTFVYSHTSNKTSHDVHMVGKYNIIYSVFEIKCLNCETGN